MIKSEGRFFINAKINEHKICTESTFPYNKFAEYKVVIDTKLKSWTVNRRFKNFEALHSEMKNKYLNLPTFPEKRFFNLSDSIIEERKLLLTDYLNFFLLKTNFTLNSPLLEFLEIEKEFIMILIKYPSAILSRSVTEQSIFDKEDLVRKAKSKEKEKGIFNFFKNSKNAFYEYDEDKLLEKLNFNLIDDLLNNLESCRENMCENLNKFWSQLKKQDTWPKFSKFDMMKLFFGSFEDEVKNGLIYYCGRVRDNVLGAEACLNLISKLTDYETNPECEKFVNVFKMSSQDQLEMMNLDRHLKCNKPIVISNALKILKLVSTGDKPIDVYSILKDPVNINKYNHYITE